MDMKAIDKYFEKEGLATLLRFLIIGQILFNFLSIGTGFFEEDYLPSELQNFLAEQYESLAAGDLFWGVISLPLVLGYLVGLIGLFFLRKWAIVWYSSTLLLTMLASLYLGPSIETPIASIFEELSLIFCGATLLFLISPYREKTFTASDADRVNRESEYFESPPIARRYIATFIDGTFMLFILIFAALLFESSHNILETVRLIIVIFAFLVYEPLLTSQYHTIGQGIMGVRARQRKNMGRISILSAYVRIITKISLGVISFVTIPFSRERRGIHDFAAGSIVIHADQAS